MPDVVEGAVVAVESSKVEEVMPDAVEEPSALDVVEKAVEAPGG